MKNKAIKDKKEQLQKKMNDIADNGDQQKVIKVVMLVAAVAIFIGLVMLVVPKSVLDGTTNKFARKEVETIRSEHIAAMLQLGNNETWESFGKKVLEDGKKDIRFPGTFAFLRAHCNLDLPDTKKRIFKNTYMYLKTVPQLKTSPDLLSLDTCKVLSVNEQEQAVLVGDTRDYIQNNYKRAKEDLEQARYQIRTIKEVRKMNKQIYGEFYDENTGKNKVEHKSPEVKAQEEKEEREMRSLLDKEARVLKVIEEYESRYGINRKPKAASAAN